MFNWLAARNKRGEFSIAGKIARKYFYAECSSPEWNREQC
jgi:hypothetical protein